MFFIPSHLLHLSQNILFSNLSEKLFNTYPSLNARNQFLQLHKTTCKVIVLYVCILVIVILDEGGKDKRPEVNVSQHGKEMHVALSYAGPFCVPHTCQRLAFNEQFTVAIVCFCTKCWVMQRTNETCKQMQNAEIPILFSLFFFFCLVFYRIFWSFFFSFSILMFKTVCIPHISNHISLAKVFKLFRFRAVILHLQTHQVTLIFISFRYYVKNVLFIPQNNTFFLFIYLKNILCLNYCNPTGQI